jgi:hypothetical protein
LEHFDTDNKLKTKAGQQTQETAVSFVGARLSFHALGRVPAAATPCFRRGMQLTYSYDPSLLSNP